MTHVKCVAKSMVHGSWSVVLLVVVVCPHSNCPVPSAKVGERATSWSDDAELHGLGTCILHMHHMHVHAHICTGTGTGTRGPGCRCRALCAVWGRWCVGICALCCCLLCCCLLCFVLCALCNRQSRHRQKAKKVHGTHAGAGAKKKGTATRCGHWWPLGTSYVRKWRQCRG
jgi:hypothetical protein